MNIRTNDRETLEAWYKQFLRNRNLEGVANISEFASWCEAIPGCEVNHVTNTIRFTRSFYA